MKNLKAQDVLVIAQWIFILALSIAVLVNRCGKDDAPKPMERAEIEEILKTELKTLRIDSLIASQKQVIESDLETLLLTLGNVQSDNKKEFESLRETISFHADRLKSDGSKLDKLTRLVTETKLAAEAQTTYQDEGELFPKWETDYSDKWVKFKNSGRIGDETSLFDLTVVNEFDLVEYRDKDGKLFADVINRNPYTVTMPGTNSFAITSDKSDNRSASKWGLNIYAGVGLSPGWDLKDVRLTPQVGVGIGRRVYLKRNR